MIQPKLTPVPDENLYELAERFAILCTIDGKEKEFAIEAGYRINGASIPAPAWILTYTPFHPKVMLPALFHDYFYDTHEVDRVTADSIFYALLVANGVREDTAEVMFQAVRVGGWVAWGD